MANSEKNDAAAPSNGKRHDLVQTLYTALLHQTFQAIAVLDGSGHIREANNTLLDIGRFRAEDIKGEAIADLPIWDGLDAARNALRAAIESAASGNFARLEIPLHDISGDLIHMDVSVKPIRSPDFKIDHLIFEARDISKLKASQDALFQSQKFEMAGQLTSGIAHDFNNILAVIAGHLEIAAKHIGADAKAGERIENALTAVFRGKELTEQLLSLSRKRELRIEAVDINAVIDQSANLLDRTLLKDCEVAFEPDDGLWPAQSDKTQLQTSIINLVINACDAMPSGGTATIKARNVSLETQAESMSHDLQPGDYVAISVQDVGIGMSPDLVRQAVEPFFTTKPPGSGTGLGLSIVDNFVRQCGGTLSISSTPDVGTEITLYLPRSHDTVADEGTPDGTAPQQDRQTTRILVVEDEEALRETVVHSLAAAGHEVEQAADGSAALLRLQEEPPFEILLTDLSLGGGLTGREVAIEAQTIQPRIKVVFMTGLPDDTEPHANPSGEVGYSSEGHILIKPFRQDELVSRIQTIVAQKGK